MVFGWIFMRLFNMLVWVLSLEVGFLLFFFTLEQIAPFCGMCYLFFINLTGLF